MNANDNRGKGAVGEEVRKAGRKPLKRLNHEGGCYRRAEAAVLMRRGGRLLTLAAACFLAGCSGKGSGDAGQPKQRPEVAVPVVVAQAEGRDVPVTLRNIGNVEAYSTVMIRSQITGQIMEVHFREGQEVKTGDLLFTIDPRPSLGALHHAQADLKRDEASLVSARLDFQRVQNLLKDSIASQGDYDKAEAAFHALEATVMADKSAVSNAALNVEFTSIRSPIDGRTGNLLVKAGNIVKAPDDNLVTINQVRPIYVTFSVPEQDLPAIRRRMREAALRVEAVQLSDGADLERGELTFIDNVVDASTGRIKLKGTFPNTDDALWPGQFVQTFLTINTLTNATVVPSAAVQSSQSGDFVFVVRPDNTAAKRSVVLGLSQGGFTVITSGAQPGETVVTDGQLRLTEGAKVTTHEAKPTMTAPTIPTSAAGGPR